MGSISSLFLNKMCCLSNYMVKGLWVFGEITKNQGHMGKQRKSHGYFGVLPQYKFMEIQFYHFDAFITACLVLLCVLLEAGVEHFPAVPGQERRWYGSPEIVDKWLPLLLKSSSEYTGKNSI